MHVYINVHLSTFKYDALEAFISTLSKSFMSIRNCPIHDLIKFTITKISFKNE